jgi:hypothetical protein
MASSNNPALGGKAVLTLHLRRLSASAFKTKVSLLDESLIGIFDSLTVVIEDDASPSIVDNEESCGSPVEKNLENIRQSISRIERV